MSLANISIVGNLVKPPEPIYFASGKEKTTLIVAVRNHFSKETDSADFYKVETWGKLAELARTYLRKGYQVTVSGRLFFDRWTDRQGTQRITPIIEASQLAFPPKLHIVESNQNDSTNGISESEVNAISGEIDYSQFSGKEISDKTEETENDKEKNQPRINKVANLKTG